MIKITIEREGSLVAQSDEAEELSFGWILAYALMANRVSDGHRLESILAGAVDSIRECGEWEHVCEYWDGYQAAIGAFCDAANQIVEGWAKHDEKNNIKEG